MDGHGRSTPTVDESRLILDKIAGLEKIIPASLVLEVLTELGIKNGRKCPLTHGIMFRVVLAMGLFTHLSIRQVFAHCKRMVMGQVIPCRSALAAGRKRLGVEPLKLLFEKLCRPRALAETRDASYRGLKLFGIDGSIYDVPDTEANSNFFGRSSGGRGEAAFPQVRKVSIVELGTHLEVGLTYGGWHSSEKTLALDLLPLIPENSLTLFDSGFFSYSLWNAIISRSRVLMRVGNGMKLTPIKTLTDGSYLAYVFADSDAQRRGVVARATVVRVIEYTIDDPQRAGHQVRHRLITNLLDEAAYPGIEMIILYHERWEQELVNDEQKTHQDPIRAEKPAHFRSETPLGVEQELYALSIGHYVIRSMMLDAAHTADVSAQNLSFVSCFRIIQNRLSELNSVEPNKLNNWYECLKQEMLSNKLPRRRNRINPRVIKRKMKKWIKKKSIHRNIPPLTKTFEQSVVMKT
jgi:hypothetical protein